MKAQEIKERLSIPEVLDYHKVSYREDRKGQVWFKIRDEKKASCKAQKGSKCWVWYDHGNGDHGTVLDLVWRLEGGTGQTDLASVLKTLHKNFPSLSHCYCPSPAQSHSQFPSTQSSYPTVVLPASRLSDKLTKLLWKERRFTPEDLEAFNIKLVKIQERWRLGVENIAGGWELFDIQPRSAGGWKRSIGPKDLAVLRDDSETGKDCVIVVAESCFDVVAVWKLMDKTAPPNGVWVSLNSLSGVARFLDWVKDLNSEEGKEVVVATDNDDAGKEAREKIKTFFADNNITCKNYWSKWKKDPAEAWVWLCDVNKRDIKLNFSP